jgi:hypothetical protein
LTSTVPSAAATRWRVSGSPVLVSAAFVVISASGPVAMWLAGFQVNLWLVVALIAALAWLFSLPASNRTSIRWAALAVVVAVLGAVTGIVVGLWLAGGALYGDWLVRDRPPVPGVPSIPRRATIGGVALLVPGWLLPNDIYRTVPIALATALALTVVAGAVGPRLRRWSAVGISVGAHGVASLVATDALNAAPSLLLLGAAMVTMAAVGWAAAPDSTWSVAANTGVLAWATPAMTWVMVNVGIWTTGIGPSGSIGYHAWLEGVSRLGGSIHEVLAATAVPAYLLGLLAVGAHLSLQGPRGVRPVVAASATAFGSAALAAWLWTVEPPMLRALIS